MTGIIDRETPRRETIRYVPFTIGAQNRRGSFIAFEFSLPYPAKTVIAMYDLTGREIASFVNRQLDAGAYRYLWDTCP